MIYSHRDGFSKHDLSDLGEVVADAAGHLRAHLDAFDFIACTGVSGLVVAAPVAVALARPLVIVRKPDDQSCHSQARVENAAAAAGRYVFIDDFIGCGTTHMRVADAIGGEGRGARESGTYMYAHKWCSFCG